MKKLSYLILIVLFVQCEKDTNVNEIPEYTIAGENSSGDIVHIETLLDEMENGDTIPGDILSTPNIFHSQSKPINIDTDEDFEIRFGSINHVHANILTYRGVFVSNNYLNNDKVEIAISQPDFIGKDYDTVMLAQIFNPGDTISNHQIWHQSENLEKPEPYFISYYFDFDSYKILSQVVGIDTMNLGNININESITDKYIGLRKKNGDSYSYGWVQCEFINFEDYQLVSSMVDD